MKIAVYSICRNEEKNVERWYNSIREADGIFVVDTGSTDNSVNLLRKFGVEVENYKYSFFRFDWARNQALEMIPRDFDVCVSIDFDEVMPSGWTEIIKEKMKTNVKRLSYIQRTFHDGVFIQDVVRDLIHRNNGEYKWMFPVHELLWPISGDIKNDKIEDSGIIVNHYRTQKETRYNYLSLLQVGVAEFPTHPRAWHYLGREYMYYGRKEEAIQALKMGLNFPGWNVEQAESMRFLALMVDNVDEKLSWLYRAISLDPNRKEHWVNLAMIYFEQKNWWGVVFAINQAISISKPSDYITYEFVSGFLPYDLVAFAYYNLGLYDMAYTMGQKAIEFQPDNVELRKKLRMYKKKQ